MDGEGDTAREGQPVAHVEARFSAEADQPDSDHGEHCGDNRQQIEPFAEENPGDKGHEHDVHGGQEGVLACGRELTAHGLERVGDEQAESDHQPVQERALVHALEPWDTQEQQKERREREPEGEQIHGRNGIKGLLHKDEGNTPDKGGGEQTEAGSTAREVGF